MQMGRVYPMDRYLCSFWGYRRHAAKLTFWGDVGAVPFTQIFEWKLLQLISQQIRDASLTYWLLFNGEAVVVSCFVAAALIYALRLTQNVPTTNALMYMLTKKCISMDAEYMAKECRLSLGVCFSLFLFMMRCDALRFCDGLCEELKFVRLALHFIWLNCKLVWLGSRGSWPSWVGLDAYMAYKFAELIENCLPSLLAHRHHHLLWFSLKNVNRRPQKAAKSLQDQRIDAYLWSLFSLWPG